LSFWVSLVRIPLGSAFSNSNGTTLVRNALILQLGHGAVEALSECVTDETPSCTGEDNASAIQIIRDYFGDRLRGEPPGPGEFLEAARDVRGHQMAKAAVEMLLWDYSAKVSGRPLDEVLGESGGYAEAGIALGLGREGEIKLRIEGAVERGYKRIKVKIDREKALDRLKFVRDAFPDFPLSADANGCFELQRDLATLKRIDKFELQYLEQPLGYPGLLDHSKLAKEISTPICLDESVTTLKGAQEVLDLEAAKVINIKPGRVGGLKVAMEIARIARNGGVHVWVGGMLETGVGRAFNVALASQRRVDYPGDISPNDRHFARDLVKNPFAMKDGRVRPNRGAGIGVEIDRDFLTRVTMSSWKIF
jgi:O-succinylbenzoate synthase